MEKDLFFDGLPKKFSASYEVLSSDKISLSKLLVFVSFDLLTIFEK